jgi:hypothetical protein
MNPLFEKLLIVAKLCSGRLQNLLEVIHSVVDIYTNGVYFST